MDAQWLKTQFETQPDKSKTGLAKAIGLEPPAISKILNNARQVKAQEYALMRKYFGLPVDGERAIAPSQQGGYVIESLAEQNPRLNDTDHKSDWVIPAGIMSQHTKASPENVKIYQVQEQLMAPEFKHGEHVVVDLSDDKPSPPGAFIVSDGFGFLIRYCEFVPSSNPPQIKISAENKSFQPQILEKDDLKIIGRVIAKLQWV